MPYDPAPANATRLKMYHLIADKLERLPELLDVGLENVARWIANGVHPAGQTPRVGAVDPSGQGVAGGDGGFAEGLARGHRAGRIFSELRAVRGGAASSRAPDR